jgi:hypothetical protein
VQLPSIVSQRADQSSSKFATAERLGRGVLQQVRSVRYRITCVKIFVKRLQQLQVVDLAEG